MDLDEDNNMEGDEEEIENETEEWMDFIYYQAEPGEQDTEDQEESDEEEQPFDITLPASHSYMGPALAGVGGRCVLAAGARARLPAQAHAGAVFPGETVPMLLTDPRDALVIREVLAKDKLFGLLCPDETGAVLSGYGVVCEIFEASLGVPEPAPEPAAAPAPGPAAAPEPVVSIKARAVHRFRLRRVPKRSRSVASYSRLRPVDVVVLPEVAPAPPLRLARPAALDARRRPRAPAHLQPAAVRRLDAAVTPWPGFVYEMFDYARLRDRIHDHFRTLGLEHLLPCEPVSLSFWAASNLAAAPRDRLALLAADSALLRLHMECRLIDKASVLECARCGTPLARREHALGMSSAGLRAHYANPGGHVHDVLTVAAASNTRAAGPPSTEFSWFPGYAWVVLVCAGCARHVGWRFEARRRALRPRSFYALCSNHVRPRAAAPAAHAAPAAPAL